MLPGPQHEAIKVLLDENHWIAQYLIGSNLEQPLLDNLNSFESLPEDFLTQLSDYVFFSEAAHGSAIELLRWSETESPHLVNRDLAAIAVLSLGDDLVARKDKVTGLFLYSEEGSPLAIEAALSFVSTKMWQKDLSKWWSWDKFLEIIDRGLGLAEYSSWCANAFLWAFQRQSHPFDEAGQDYIDLVEALKEPLQQLPSKRTDEFCQMRQLLGVERIWQMKVLEKKTEAKKTSPLQEPRLLLTGRTYNFARITDSLLEAVWRDPDLFE